jgi:hypothetical protein
LGWIWVFNLGTFVLVDIGKVYFKNAIGDAPGEIIDSDELVEVKEDKTEVEQFREKVKRYNVHRASAVDPADLQRTIEIGSRGSIFGGMGGSFTDGIINQQLGARLQLVQVAATGSGPVHRRSKTVSSPELTFGH